VRDATAAGRRGVGHDRDRRLLEQFWNLIFVHVAGEFHVVAGVLALHRVHVARGLRMIAAADNQLRVGKGLGDDLEGFDHQLQALVRSPLSESEDAVLGIAPLIELGILRAAREHAMGANMHIVAAVLVVQDLAIARHQDGNRVGQQ